MCEITSANRQEAALAIRNKLALVAAVTVATGPTRGFDEFRVCMGQSDNEPLINLLQVCRQSFSGPGLHTSRLIP